MFLRDYDMADGVPVANGHLLGGIVNDDTCPADTNTVPCYNDGNATDGNISTWAAVKQQAAQKLGLLLKDKDVTDIPMLATDPYGEFIPGPNGLPQYALKDGSTLEGNLAEPGPGARERRALRHPVPDRHRAQRGPVAPGHGQQPGNAACGTGPGRQHHRDRRLREPGAWHV